MSNISEEYTKQDLCFGIDQSLTCTGWCVTNSFGEVFDYGVIRTSPCEGGVVGTVGRCVRINEELMTIINKFNPSLLSIEGLAMGNIGGNSSRDLAGLQFIMIASFTNAGYDVIVTPPTRIKKFATGKGNSKKEALFESLPTELKMKFSSIPKSKGRYDLTDAYWLSRYGYGQSL